MSDPKPGEVWRVRGLWDHEPEARVRIDEVLDSGSVDVNYQLNPDEPGDCRILPRACLIARVEPEPFPSEPVVDRATGLPREQPTAIQKGTRS